MLLTIGTEVSYQAECYIGLRANFVGKEVVYKCILLGSLSRFKHRHGMVPSFLRTELGNHGAIVFA